jgi:hypothetical protein
VTSVLNKEFIASSGNVGAGVTVCLFSVMYGDEFARVLYSATCPEHQLGLEIIVFYSPKLKELHLQFVTGSSVPHIT